VEIFNVTILEPGGSRSYHGAGVWALVARGSYVYAVNHGAGTTGTLTVLNVSNPSSVTVAATRSLGGSTGVDICLSGDGNYAYVSNYGANGQVWNVSNPAAPTLAATLGQTHNGCSVSGSYLYTIDRNGSLFRIYDISNPASPVLKSTVTQTGGADNLTVSGDYAFIPTTNDDKVYVWNVSNKTSPSLVGSTPFVGDPANNYMCRWMSMIVMPISEAPAFRYSITLLSAAPTPPRSPIMTLIRSMRTRF